MKKFLSLFLLFVSVKIYSQSQAICAGSSATLHATPVAVANSTLVVPGTPTVAFTATSGNFVISPTVTTTYTIYTPSTNSFVMTVTVNPMPVVAPTYTQASCTSTASGFNFHLTFNPNSPPPSYTVAWSPPPPPPVTTIPVIPDCITSPTDFSCTGYISPGAYQASITAAGGCQVIVSFTMNPAPAPAIYSVTPAASIQSITCAVPILTISANNPGLAYTWTSTTLPPNITQTVNLTSANAGTLTVVGTNTNSGCTTTKTIAIVVNTTIPTGALTPSNISLNCTTAVVPDVTLTATSPTVNFTHRINTPNGTNWTSNLPVCYYQFGPPGTYSYCLTNDANGCSLCRNFSVSISGSYPTYTLSSPDNFTVGCGTKSVATVAFANQQAGTPGAGLTFTFIPPGGNPNITGPYSGISSTSLTTPGQWTVIAFEAGSNCQTKSPMTILQNTVAPKLDTVLFTRGGLIYSGSKLCGMLTCDSTQVIMKAMTETPNTSFKWSYGNSPVQNLTTPTVAVNATITAPSVTIANVAYTLTLRDEGNYCSTASTYTVFHNVEPPIARIVPQNGGTNFLTCLKNSLVLNNLSTSGIKNPFFDKSQPAVGYLWNGPSPQTTLASSSSYTAGVVGEYTMTARDLNNGCLSTTVLSIFDDRLKPLVTAPSGFTIDCGPIESLTSLMCMTIPTQSDLSTFTYSWTPPIVLPGSVNTNSCYIPKSVGVYTLVTTNGRNGCVTSSTVQVKPATIVGALDLSTTTGFAPLSVNFFNNTTSASGTGTGITTFWNFGNGTSSVTASPGTTSTSAVISNSALAMYNLPGTYTVKVIMSKAPCRDSVTKVINVDVPSTLDIPNVFTPNGDGINDFYFLKANSLTKISMSIYDRWGRLIFEVIDATTGNISWDGKNPSGKDCPDGTYFYHINATGKDGKDFSKEGTITLAR